MLFRSQENALLGVKSAMPMQCIKELVQWARYAKGMGGLNGSKFGIPLNLMISDLWPDVVGVVSIR